MKLGGRSRSGRSVGAAFAVLSLAAGAQFATAPSASAALIDFELYKTGTILSNQYFAAFGVTIFCDNYRVGGPDKAILFNSNRTNTADDDLEFGTQWSAGNIKNENLNKFLIVAENVRDASPVDGFVDDPDDEADGGMLGFKWTTPQTMLGFDLIDLELVPEQDKVEFYRNGALLKTVTFDKFTQPGVFFRPGVEYADRSANRIQPITIADLGLTQGFDEVRFQLPECVAIDNVFFSNVNVPTIPEPSSVMVLSALTPMLAMRRRRNRNR